MFDFLKKKPELDLSEIFNALSGKVVNLNEFNGKLEKMDLGEAKSVSNRKSLQKQETAAQEVLNSTYTTSETLQKVEAAIRNFSNGNPIAQLALKTQPRLFTTLADGEIERNKENLFGDAVPLLKFAVARAAGGNKKGIEAVVKALQGCADHKNRVGADLQEVQPALAALSNKITAQL